MIRGHFAQELDFRWVLKGERCSLDTALVRNSSREPCTLGRAGGRTSSLSSRSETLPKAEQQRGQNGLAFFAIAITSGADSWALGPVLGQQNLPGTLEEPPPLPTIISRVISPPPPPPAPKFLYNVSLKQFSVTRLAMGDSPVCLFELIASLEIISIWTKTWSISLSPLGLAQRLVPAT